MGPFSAGAKDAVGWQKEGEDGITGEEEAMRARGERMQAEEISLRIAELEESLQRERAMTFSKIQRQRHAIANLCRAKRERGKALVEERIAGEFSDWIENQCPHWEIDDDPFCVALGGPCEYREGKCPIQTELLARVREQLRAEGKL